MAERYSKFLKNPTQLLDVVDYLIKKFSQQKASEVSSHKVVQFYEISKTIERLNEAGAIVPDELRRLKLELSCDVLEHEKISEQRARASVVLQEMELRLSNSITELRSAITRLNRSNNTKTKTKRYVKRTSPSILAKEIRKALRELGGSAKKSDVLQRVKLNMDGKFKPQDLERDSNGNLNWEKWAITEKSKMIKEGVLKAGTSFGIWELRRK